MQAFRRRLPIIVALLGIPLTGAGVDIYAPSLPPITDYFQTSREWVQLSLSVYIFFYGLFQILWGTLSDSWGRKKLLNAGLAGFALVSVLAAMSPNLPFLLGMRALQGTTVAIIGTVTRTIPVDLYEGNDLKKMMVYFSLCWAVGPILAPVLGGYLQTYFNWRASFIFLANYSFILFFVSFFMAETNVERHQLDFQVLKKNFAVIFQSPIFWGVVFMTLLTYSSVAIFGVVAPFLVQDVMHYSPAVYGHIALYIGFAWFLGNFASRVFLQYSIHKTIPLAVAINLLIVVAAIFYANVYSMTLLSLTLPTCVLMLVTAFIFTVAYSHSMMIFPKLSGTASSAMGLITATSTGVLTAAASLLKTHNTLPLFAAFLGITLFIGLAYLVLVRQGFK